MSFTNNNFLSSKASLKNLINIICNQKHGLNVCHINAQSLFNKLDEFRYIFEKSNIDIICISETWFNDAIGDGLILVNGYKIYRSDRSSHGGGVAIYIRDHISAKVICKSDSLSKIEYIFIEIGGNEQKILIGCIYRPNKYVSVDNLLHVVENLAVNYTDVIIAGDLNSNILKESSLINSFTSLGLNSVNSTIPTHFSPTSSSLLDLFIVADKRSVLLYDQLSASCFSQHDLIFIKYDYKTPHIEKDRSYHDFRQLDHDQLAIEFINIEWNAIYYMRSADEQLKFLNRNVQQLFTNVVPIRKLLGGKRRHCWFNPTIEHLIAVRDTCHSRWKKFKTNQLYNEFSAARKEATEAIKLGKIAHYGNRFKSAVVSKKKWCVIKDIGIGNTVRDDVHADVNELNQSFVNFPTPVIASTSTSEQPSHIIPETSQRIESSFEFSCVTAPEVMSSCVSIGSNAVGIDNVHPRFLKILLPHLVPYITHIFNTILITSTFPAEWKHAIVIPLPKLNNEHRPISILPYLSKAFERLIHKQINDYLNEHSLLTTKQSGFRAKHSCTTALIDVSDEIRRNIDRRENTFLVLLDHSKAFDSVNHETLCTKLRSFFNFSNTATTLISTYLSHRKQSVTVGNIVSNPLDVTKGVPQGSILGPLLFTLYINDLPDQLSWCNIHIYADDVQLYYGCSDDNLLVGVQNINCDLQRIFTWASNNSLFLNPQKSKCLFISRKKSSIPLQLQILLNNEKIEVVDKCRNLGVIFNSTLTWTDHINSTTGKIFGMLRSLYKTQFFTPQNIRELLAKSYLIPKLLYCCELFADSDSKSKHRLNVAYNAIIRYVYKLRRFDRISTFSKKLFGVSFDDLLKVRTTLLFHKIIYTKEPAYLHSKLNIGRSQRRILIVPVTRRYLVSEKQFFVNSVRLWNSLPGSLQHTSNTNVFKKLLFNLFM